MASEPLEHRELSKEERDRIHREFPEFDVGDRALLVHGDPDVVAQVAEFVHQMREEEHQSQDVLDALTQDPAAVTIGEERLLQLHKHAERRKNFLRHVECLTSAQIADLRGSKAANRSALANRWRAEGKVFAVRRGEGDLYPAFQFSREDGRPLPVMEKILALFGDADDWTVALWFNSPAGWLDGALPHERIGEEPERVLGAARRSLHLS